MAEGLASKVDLTDQLLPWVVPRTSAVRHEAPVRLEGQLDRSGMEPPQCPRDLEPRLWPSQTSGSAVTAPFIFAGCSNRMAANRVEDDVPYELEKVRFSFHQNALETTLKEMAGASVPSIEALGIITVQGANAAREVRLGRLDEQMIVVPHEDVAVKDPPPLRDDRAKQGEKVSAIAVIAVDGTALIATTCDMPDRARKFETERTGHRGRAEEGSSDRNEARVGASG